MATPTVRFAKVNINATIPQYAHDTDSGFDFVALKDEYISFGEVTLVHTGLAVEMPTLAQVVGIGDRMPYSISMEMQIRSKSGLAAKHGISVVNGVGTIDWSYRGEILVALTKVSPGTHMIPTGSKFAQGVFAPVFTRRSLIFSEVQLDELQDTARGSGGFGSTGK